MADALRRRIGLPLLIFYGVGIMIGAGIYVLIGEVAASSGAWAPAAFALAGLVAAPTALSYAELSARFPEAAGEVAYVEAGLGRKRLAAGIGLLIVAAGTVSAGAVLKGGIGYLTAVVPLDPALLIVLVGGLLVALAIAGAVESLAFAAMLTVIEVGGLFMVAGAGALAEPAVVASPAPVAVGGLALGAGLAFFAFIGFEDIVNMAEETRDPERLVPRAVLASLVITVVIYCAVAWASVRAVGAEALAASDRPLALVWEQAAGGRPETLSVIAVAAALNGVLAQIVMAARIIFGLGRRHRAFERLGHVTPRFGTPGLATVLVGAAVIAAALALPVARLAALTTSLLLAVFIVVNFALIRLKRATPAAPFRVPGFVPYAGVVLSFAAFCISVWSLG